MKSVMYESEKVVNLRRRFGADTEYYPCTVVLNDGQRMPALFTAEQVQLGIDRGRMNAEDLPEPTRWERIVAWLYSHHWRM